MVLHGWFESYLRTVDPMTTVTASPEGTLDFTLIAGRHPVAGTAQRQEYHAGPDGVW